MNLVRDIFARPARSLAFALACAASLGGCRRMEMSDQPKNKPLTASDFFADGTSARPLVDGVVSRDNLRIDRHYYQGKTQDASTHQWVDCVDLPPQVQLSEQLLERGQQRFMVYCVACHGRLGDGNGMVANRGIKRPPSYHDPRLVNAPIGHFFDVMTNGYGAMMDYSAQVTVPDRWAIACYIRALQVSQNAPQEAVSQARLVVTTQPSTQPTTAPAQESADANH